MMPAVTRRARLHSDPFQAVHLLAERMPNNIYKPILREFRASNIYFNSYTPHDFEKPDTSSNFTCALTTNFGLETLLLEGTWDGVGADTSWRNKNEN